jgi:hypothetical protein
MKASNGIAILLSIAFILYGCFGKSFYWATGIVYTSKPSKRGPPWFGRLMFIGVGMLILIPELVHLISPYFN